MGRAMSKTPRSSMLCCQVDAIADFAVSREPNVAALYRLRLKLQQADDRISREIGRRVARIIRPGDLNNGACFTVLMLDGGYGFVHVAADGRPSAFWGGYETSASAASDARQEALQRDCVLLDGGAA
jgi:hypothetical protein